VASQKQLELQGQRKRVEGIVSQHPDGAGIQDLADVLNRDAKGIAPPRRTLQSWLKRWVDEGYLTSTGANRGTRYFLANTTAAIDIASVGELDTSAFPFSKPTEHLLQALRKPLIQRNPVAYQFDFLNTYRPNVSAYLNDTELDHLASLGGALPEQPAGTFVRQLLNRFLIDLSWNSSRLEGNTYSLLDTRRLIHFGAAADGKASIEAQMILNHKEAIEFLVDNTQDIGFNRYTLLNLHALLSNNLLENPQASGRLRSIAVGIGKSAFQPPEVPQLIQEYFEQILASATAIHNPFEQALFILVQLPYLQPFDDVNKRVSRLAANIPLIKHNLIPLSFTDIPRDTYIESILAVYELNRIEPLKEVFIWAYERSVNHYQVVRQTLGEPDEFRLRYRQAFKDVIKEVIRSLLDKQQAYTHINKWMHDEIPEADQSQFLESAETELLSLHEGNFARYQIRPAEFEQWQKVWQNYKDSKA
jgi:Fic family protein